MSAIRTAKLTSGLLSDEKGIKGESQRSSLPIADKNILDDVMMLLDHPSQPTIVSAEEEEGVVIERGTWQAFVVLLQLQFPDVAMEIEPAHKVGQLPISRVMISGEIVELLNSMIDKWFGKEVEIHSLEHVRQRDIYPDPTINVHMEVPFYPVTGLHVVVVPVAARSMVSTEKRILDAKTEVSRASGVTGIALAHQLYVKEEWSTFSSRFKEESDRTRKRARAHSLLARWKTWMG